nr:MAG: hypothetical protein [Bacteriophage sp.]
MQTYYPIISAVLCLLCFLCCKGWSVALDVGAGRDKRILRMARTFGIAGDVFHWATWAFIAAGFIRAFGLV